MVDSASYTLSSPVGGISIDSSGTTTVSTANAIDLTSLTVSVTTNGGAETIESQPFKIEVLDNEEKLAVQPEKSYEIEIGKMNTFYEGKFQGNDIDQVLSSYKISKASNISLEDEFKVELSYDKGTAAVSLKIDLTQTDPNLAGSSVLGLLSIWNKHTQKAFYEIEFKLLC